MHEAIAKNPFFILGVHPSASAREVERQGRKLLHQLQAGVGAAGTMRTPFGPLPRTADDVRAAMATLADPDKRLVAEIWARLPTPLPQDEGQESERFDDAFSALRWWR